MIDTRHKITDKGLLFGGGCPRKALLLLPDIYYPRSPSQIMELGAVSKRFAEVASDALSLA